MQGTDTNGAKFVRGLVRTIFIACYAAFMWASIHHVAAFFNAFEQNATGDMFGSYLLAGAIDVTALVTTIGVMFFRKSMPRYVLVALWIFIVGLALYSLLINWEYASHYQDTSLILQPTGATTPVFDQQGNLHYVPVMVENLWLLNVNPLIASGFTIFALIYSVVGEFFGAKQPTSEELLAKKTYLESTVNLLEDIRKLEEKGKGTGWIERAKQTALEVKAAAKEITKKEETIEESIDETVDETTEQTERNTDELDIVISEETGVLDPRYNGLSEEETLVATHYPDSLSWLSGSGSTVSLKTVASTMKISMKLLRNRVASKQIKQTRNAEIVTKASIITWAISELLPVETQRTMQIKAIRKEPVSMEETSEQPERKPIQLGMIENAMLDAINDATSEQQSELQQLAREKSLTEFTAILKAKYPNYASYIIESRVANVMLAMGVSVRNEAELQPVN
jgi:hypothetical protein